MKKKTLVKKPKSQTKKPSLTSVSQISDYPSPSPIQPPADFSISQFPSNQNPFQSTFPNNSELKETSIPSQPTSNQPLNDYGDSSISGYQGLPGISIPIQANPSVPEDEEDLPDISCFSSSNIQGNFLLHKAPFPNIPTMTSTYELSNDTSIAQENAIVPAEDQELDLPDISGFSQNPISTEENQFYNYSCEPQQPAPIDEQLVEPPINQFIIASGLEEIKEEAEEVKEEVEEIKVEPKIIEEVVKNKRIIIDLPLTMKCEYCEYERFESDFFPMHFGAEKEVVCRMCWNARINSVKKEKIEVLNECSTCEEWKHRYYGEKICPNNCIVCEDCQYCYIFNCKIRDRKEESCAFCDRKLIKKEQPWTLVA